jgi:hypothetical protein
MERDWEGVLYSGHVASTDIRWKWEEPENWSGSDHAQRARRRWVAHSAYSTTSCAIFASIAIVQSQYFECVYRVRCMGTRVYKTECLCLYCHL